MPEAKRSAAFVIYFSWHCDLRVPALLIPALLFLYFQRYRSRRRQNREENQSPHRYRNTCDELASRSGPGHRLRS